MKKIIFKIIIFIVMIVTFTSGIKTIADETEDEQNKISELQEILEDNKESMEGLYNYIDGLKLDVELMNELNPKEYVESYIKDGKGNISFDKMFDAIISLVFKEVKSVLKLAVIIVTIGIMGTLIKSLHDSFNSKGISDVAFYSCYIILIMILSKSFLISISIAKEVITNISDFMAAILPILVSMITLSGGVVEATTIDPILLAVVMIVPKIYKSIIIPLVLIFFAMQFANNLSNEHKIDGLCKLVKQGTMWMQGIILTIFIGILTIRGITGSTIDAVTLKTTKFAIDNFIPIVGKSFSDAIASVAAYSLIIKNAISSIGLIVIIIMIVYPLIKIVLTSFIYKLSSAILEPVSDKRITSSIQASGEAMTIILSCIMSVSLMFFILLAIMASAGKYIVGI
ncbi:stage III sporulation protein AE [Clostridium sp. MSJ-8]|uniref:stage III sporulation protein AE n=1 Tax=Clostridium sp. MSJ-8 TaxID=2841510 RepID=UPI001C0F2415|nr:stage III sporulation protein AE [Clostridium sp. MSJ-8]MBU5487533.1 stage III sporulation protein AE [Clostridium sp. MSJ-8]